MDFPDGPGTELGDGRSRAPVEEGAPLWTVTFGDMMSLLLTFFILLFSMSELRMEQFLLASEGLREAMGGTAPETVETPVGPLSEEMDPEMELQSAVRPPTPSVVTPPDGELTADSAAVLMARAEELADQYLDSIAEKLRHFVVEHGLEETVEVEKTPEGVYLRLQAVVLFRSGEASIVPDNAWLVEVLARITRQIGTRVVVAGHADDRPISTPVFASNWELSAARAAGVARGLVEGGHDPLRLRVESYGSHLPVADNATPEGRSRNRRVELFYAREDVVDDALKALKEPAPAGDTLQGPGSP